jgi:hypothetical protein
MYHIALFIEYEHVVPNLTTIEWEKAAKYNILAGNWYADENQRANLQYCFTICQGNWGDFTEVIKLGHFY